MKYFVFAVLFFGMANILKAQYFETGQDPASIKWRQINTENFQLIYPDYYETQAQKLASVLEKVYLFGGRSLEHQPKKISIILHTQTVKSNGLVAWAPKRAEFYTIPHQDNYSEDWLEQLAIHEFRHVVQTDKVNSELPKIIKILLGEQGTALVFGAYLPWWFIEGDAVVTETALSNSGRGRFPSFLMEHQALAVEKGNYKYDKAYNGSLKNYVPNHYQLGYYLVGTARQKYGNDLWINVLNMVGEKPFSLNPFNKALKEKTEQNKVQLYNSLFDELQQKWKAEDEKREREEFTIITKADSKTYTNYRYNHWLNDSVIFSYRTALNRVPAFVKIDETGNPRKFFTPGIIFEESVNFQGDWIIWSERVPDLRWQHSGKSLIRLLNLSNKRKITLKTEFTAMAPAISPDNSKIAVVESNYASEFFLSVYQISDGKLISRYQTPGNHYFFSPAWMNENELAVVVLFPEGKRLCKVNYYSGVLTKLSNSDLGEIKNLVVKNGNIYFTGTFFGKNSLYCLNPENNEVARVFEGRFGVESPAFSKNANKVILSDYTSDGFRLIKASIKEQKLDVLNQNKEDNYPLANALTVLENGIADFGSDDTTKYTSEKYNKFTHLFNFHSWAPVAVDADFQEIKPGVSLMSQNKLGTAFLNMGYEWDLTQKTGGIYGKYTYKGWYPVFDVQIKSGKSSSEYVTVEQTKSPSGEVLKQDTVIKRFTWYNSDFSADINLPLNFSRGKYYRYLQPELRYNYTLYKHDSSTPDKFYEGDYQSLTYRLYFQQNLYKSYQDVYSDFGFAFDFLFRHSPFGKTDLGNLGLAQSWFFVPGIMPNHGIRFYAGIQDKNSPGSVSFADVIKYPRGWGKTNTNNMKSFGVDYKFPVFYPEWNLGGLAYLKRVNASLFADYAYLNANIYSNGNVSGTYNTDISSIGLELTGDAHFLRFYAPVEIGFRSSYLPKMKNVYFDFLLSIDFNSL